MVKVSLNVIYSYLEQVNRNQNEVLDNCLRMFESLKKENPDLYWFINQTVSEFRDELVIDGFDVETADENTTLMVYIINQVYWLIKRQEEVDALSS